MSAPLWSRRDRTSQALFELADREQRRLRNRRMRARGQGRKVHNVQLVDWVDGLHLPMPACRQPAASPSLLGDLEPTTADTTCRRCLEYPSALERALPADRHPGQLSLLTDLDTYRERRAARDDTSDTSSDWSGLPGGVEPTTDLRD